MKTFKPWQICAVATFTLAAFVPAASAASSGSGNDYSNQTPYGNPKDTPTRTPPKGYSLFFIETVGRHGARPLTSDSTEKRVLSVWDEANKKKALTDVGKTLSRDVKKFQSAERKVGYGDLSGIGRDEMRGIGRRTAANYSSFFSSVKKKKATIVTASTDVSRTKQSVTSLRSGLRDKLGKSLDKVLAKPSVAHRLLHIGNRASSNGKSMTSEVRNRSSIRGYAKDVLGTSYKRSYVDSIKDPVGAALDLYLLYATAPGMQKETNITFARYVPKADREPLSYVTDGTTFYKYGPGVKGESNTFEDARPLLRDFFDRLDNRIGGSSTAAVFRVGHGETIMPFAALIKAPGSEFQTPKGVAFSRGTNPWRGSKAGKLGGNIEWTAFRNSSRKVLVTMRYNENPVPFNKGCTPYRKGSYFYTVGELKHCLG
jgi:hypothetical protein